ncbi:MAG: hypothetical protein A2Z15_03510 [Chloroflexi bacterium RBG_16_50_11]|nr:MAG: hypothetical protein A2Z15_03510 [Chloroflexi bacterium RBG_16_50_11]
MKLVRILALLVLVAGVAAVVIGGVFISQGIAKNNIIVDRMNVEKVSIALDPENPNVFTAVNDSADAQAAADIIATHRRNIAPTYQDLLKGGRFNSANTTHLTYAQAMNLENYLYMAVTAFGLIQVTIANGAFMIIIGLAIGGAGFALYRVAGKQA